MYNTRSFDVFYPYFCNKFCTCLSDDDDEVYSEEKDYENEWNIENDNGNEINEKESEEESEAGNEDEYRGSTDEEERCMLKNLRVHYKGY